MADGIGLGGRKGGSPPKAEFPAGNDHAAGNILRQYAAVDVCQTGRQVGTFLRNVRHHRGYSPDATVAATRTAPPLCIITRRLIRSAMRLYLWQGEPSPVSRIRFGARGRFALPTSKSLFAEARGPENGRSEEPAQPHRSIGRRPPSTVHRLPPTETAASVRFR